MINKKIYFWWSDEEKLYSPSGRKPGENIRYKPIQGYGVCEIAAWLATDLPTGMKSIDIWINNLTDLTSSRAPDGFFGMGNAHWVMVTGNMVFIACEYVPEQRVLITIEQLLYVLEQYKAFLVGNYTNSDFPPEPIDVEYIAEGEEATRMYVSLEGSHGVFYLEE